MSSPLNGQVVMVTGAGRGIGQAAAEVLAARGAKVGVLDIDPATAEATAVGDRKGGRRSACADRRRRRPGAGLRRGGAAEGRGSVR